MDWFKRAREGLKPQKKKELPNLWIKCDSCGEINYKQALEKNYFVCTICQQYHFRVKSADYIKFLLDENSFDEFGETIVSKDFLKFKATKKYADQIKEAIKTTGQNDAVRTGFGKVRGIPVVIGIMDFSFIGGSMGSVVGEKLARAAHKALEKRVPLIIVSSSGGARMMEGAISLMQLAKTSAALARLADHGIPFISIICDPTTGGVTASYAMLGDVILAEPGALIGFAGPRVIKQTIGQDLPDGFQRSEFQLKHGFVDAVVSRQEMREKVQQVLEFATDLQPALSDTELSNGKLEHSELDALQKPDSEDVVENADEKDDN
jgi:acetyl-CoA carboxylase carboxyl transferase subunit beta